MTALKLPVYPIICYRNPQGYSFKVVVPNLLNLLIAAPLTKPNTALPHSSKEQLEPPSLSLSLRSP